MNTDVKINKKKQFQMLKVLQNLLNGLIIRVKIIEIKIYAPNQGYGWS